MLMEPEVIAILRATPEFADRYVELVEDHDEHPGAPATLEELADFTAELIHQIEQVRPVLGRIMTTVENLCCTSGDGRDLVMWSFLDNLAPDYIEQLADFMGPATRALIDELELPDLP